MNYEEISDYDVLRRSADLCKAGVLWKDSVAHYDLNASEETLKLSEDLKNGTYRPRPPKKFKITSPKEREIVSVAFRDRVYQRALNDNILFPTMSKSFIHDNYACQPGKGTDSARDRLKEFLHKQYRKVGANFYVLQIDIRKYYDSLDHELVEEMFREKLPTDVYEATVEVLHSQYPSDKGYNPGSQLVQIAGVSYLDGMDHFIKERLGIKYYLRYMDDAIIIHDDPYFLEESCERIRTYLEERRLELHPKKTRIYHISYGIPFLGFTFRITETGKVLMHVNTDSVRREKRKLKKLVDRCKQGLMSESEVNQCYTSWLAHIRKGNSYLLERRMNDYYRDLWRE